MEEIGNMENFARALRQHPKNVIYQDYQPKDDFTLWLQGYREKIRSGYGFTAAEDDEVNAEVVRAISGKLEPGPPLDTYDRLPADVKENYDRLVEILTQEFLDPQEKRKFLKDFSFNKRKKGQSIQEFKQEIINHQHRYSGMPDKIIVGQDSVVNKAKVGDGIRRFMTGMRDKNGRKNRELEKALNYRLMDDEDLTWENAVDTAVRWEGANNIESSSSDDEDAGVVALVEDSRGARQEEKEKRRRKKKPTTLSADVSALNEAMEGMSLSLGTLGEQVEANSRDIAEIKDHLERTDADMASWREETTSTLDRILHIVEGPYEEPPQLYQGMVYYQ